MQWLMQFREAALNPSQNNTEAMAGFCDCSKKLSKQIIAEAEDSCHTITLSNCSLSTMNPRHMLLFYGVLFYGIHMVISAFCNTKILRQQYENISSHAGRSQVELTLLMYGSPGMRTAECQQLNIFSICLKWLELLCQLLTTVGSTHTYVCPPSYTCTHADTHTTRTQRKTHSVQRRANQLSNRLSVLIFIIRLGTYGSALIRRLCLGSGIRIHTHPEIHTETTQRQRIDKIRGLI